MRRTSRFAVAAAVCGTAWLAWSQGPGGPPNEGPRIDLVEQFDADGDGRLNDAERAEARVFAQQNPQRRGPGRRGGRQETPAAPVVLEPKSTLEQDLEASRQNAVDESAELYDDSVLRTLYLRFPNNDWHQELADFYNTGVNVPAALIVDGRRYDGVGVRFRGNSSYFTLGASLKKSFNLSMNHDDPDQRLYGYRTLNLLNSHADPSFLREALFSRVSREYMPALKVNFVRLVVNGENWGVYVNSQQFNSDFIEEAYGERGGDRWKVPANPRGGDSGLALMEGGVEAYRRRYEIRSSDNDEAWESLMELSRVLNEAPAEELAAQLEPILDVDETLRFLALDNAFIDQDGYMSRASDYNLYRGTDGRFHLISHDNNETFRFGGRGGGPSDTGGDPQVSPLVHLENPDRPLIRRLLSNADLQARYLGYVRYIAQEWLDWERLGQVAEAYRSLISAELERDDKKLTSYDAFRRSVEEDIAREGGGSPPGGAPAPPPIDFNPFGPPPEGSDPPTAAQGPPPAPGGQSGRGGGRTTPGLKRFATERRAYLLAQTEGVPALEPPQTRRRVGDPIPTVDFPVVINELMALNRAAVEGPDGAFSDWIELYNRSDKAVDLSGMALSDDPDERDKWRFPDGTVIAAGGYLIVWADGGAKNAEGLHASFRLSREGETLLLTGLADDGFPALDAVRFEEQEEDVSFGRTADGAFARLRPSPGQPNEEL
ncbi:MAG: CotH kinase family protein [Candidatus Poribacteria bacterium]|nr:CotH kinase family protein [Candidatus Poribacteria bacterium]